MPDTPPQSRPSRVARVAIPVILLNAVLRPFLSALVRGKIRRAEVDMEALRELLSQYQSILAVEDQDVILVNFHNLQETRQSLRSRTLPLSDYLEQAKDYELLARSTLEITKDASERARDNDMVGRMARDTGLTEFNTDHPMLGLQRVHSTISDSSDYTLPVAPVNSDIYYSIAITDEEASSESSMMTCPELESIAPSSEPPMMTCRSEEGSIAPLTDTESLVPTSVGD